MKKCYYMKDKSLIEKISKYCNMLDETLNEYNNDYNTFKESHIFQNSACMCLLQIGELCKYLTKEFRDKHDEVDWKGWCGLRDVFAHQYGRLNTDENWDTIINDYPILRDNVIKILKEINS